MTGKLTPKVIIFETNSAWNDYWGGIVRQCQSDAGYQKDGRPFCTFHRASDVDVLSKELDENTAAVVVSISTLDQYEAFTNLVSEIDRRLAIQHDDDRKRFAVYVVHNDSTLTPKDKDALLDAGALRVTNLGEEGRQETLFLEMIPHRLGLWRTDEPPPSLGGDGGGSPVPASPGPVGRTPGSRQAHPVEVGSTTVVGPNDSAKTSAGAHP